MPSVYQRITQFNSDRVPELVKLKYQFMAEDPFRFYRGTCHLFFEDLAKKMNWKDDTKAWICGDLHLENFGTYRGDNRVVYFDLNDFDEALLAPASWDVVRLLTSIYIAARVLSFDEATADALCKDFIDTYIATLQSGKALAVEKETATGLLKYFIRTVAQRSTKELVKSRTIAKKKQLQLIIDGQKYLPLPKALKKSVTTKLSKWLDHKFGKGKFKVLDAAYRIAGTGSVGVKRYVVLNQTSTGEHHLIDIKEAKPSSLLPYTKIKQPAWPSDAERVITLQKRVEYVAPAYLHPLQIGSTSFVVKELQPIQDKMDLRLCKGKLKKLACILNSMAQLTAAAQLRSSSRQGSSPADQLIAFADNSKLWRNKVLRYAKRYEKQVVKDYDAYCARYKKQLEKA